MGRNKKSKQTSIHKGIHFEKKHRKWKAYSHSGIFLGYYDSEPDAIKSQEIGIPKPRAKTYRTRKVYQYDDDLILIKEFDSILIAAKETGSNPQLVRRCCNFQQHTSNGYIWFWENNRPTTSN
jgi:hypothetical protein